MKYHGIKVKPFAEAPKPFAGYPPLTWRMIEGIQKVTDAMFRLPGPQPSPWSSW
jgi:hypothetical protein